MAHHKRRRPKSKRAGCLTCKPWKHERQRGLRRTPAVRRRDRDAREQLATVAA